MKFTFVQPASFAAEWNRLRLSDDDLRFLESQIMDRPEIGAVMRSTGGLRKMRFSPPSWERGKSGALRICYVCFREFATIYLMLLFAKSEKANLSAAECAHVRKWIAFLRQRLEEVEP